MIIFLLNLNPKIKSVIEEETLISASNVSKALGQISYFAYLFRLVRTISSLGKERERNEFQRIIKIDFEEPAKKTSLSQSGRTRIGPDFRCKRGL